MSMELRWTYTIARPMACPFLACRDHADQVMVIVQELHGPSLLRLDAEGRLVWQTTMPVPPRAEEGSGGRLITHAQWGTDQPSRLFTHEADQVFEIDAEDGAILRTVGVDFVIQALAFVRLASGERLMVVGGPEGQVLAFDQTFQVRWRYVGQPGPVTHCFFTHDIDGDGADEIFFRWTAPRTATSIASMPPARCVGKSASRTSSKISTMDMSMSWRSGMSTVTAIRRW